MVSVAVRSWEKIQNSSVPSYDSKRQWSTALTLLKKPSETQGVVPPQEVTSSINSILRRSSSPEEEVVVNAHQEFGHLDEAVEPVLPIAGEAELPIVGEPELSLGSQSGSILPCGDNEQATAIEGTELMANSQSQQADAIPSNEPNQQHMNHLPTQSHGMVTRSRNVEGCSNG
ncbi:hypothetical protein V6N11_041969 [Hibiscus sabdariffa]|uniref:Uncharacterized protein n=1 Tax=Hibiscus sabdariffa TaxID=183260 RepID=A0ABR2QUV0_9ROSI